MILKITESSISDTIYLSQSLPNSASDQCIPDRITDAGDMEM